MFPAFIVAVDDKGNDFFAELNVSAKDSRRSAVGSEAPRYPVTPDGRYFVVRGTLWRCSNQGWGLASAPPW